jgi:hypothetical protein
MRARLALGVLALVALAAGVVPIGRCDVVRVPLAIPGFDSARVAGVTFWRLEPGGLVEDGRLIFEGLEYRGAEELLHYRYAPREGGSSRLAFRSRVERSATDPDVVVVELLYPRRSEPGRFRISTFNAGGESLPTQADVPL